MLLFYLLQSPPKGATIPYRPKPQVGGPVILAGGQAYTIQGNYAVPAHSDVSSTTAALMAQSPHHPGPPCASLFSPAHPNHPFLAAVAATTVAAQDALKNGATAHYPQHAALPPLHFAHAMQDVSVFN